MSRLLVLALLGLLSACGAPDDPRVRLDRYLAQAQAAAEARDTGDLMELVAADYRDAEGRDRQALRGYVRGMFLRYGSVHVDLQVLDAAGLGDRGGEVLLWVGLAGQRGDNNPLWRLGADRYRVRLELVNDKPGEPFHLLRARWERDAGGGP